RARASTSPTRSSGRSPTSELMAQSLTLRQIVERLGGEAVGEVAEGLTGVATLDSAGPREIAFLANPKYRSRLASTKAGAVILGPGDRGAAALPRIGAENPHAGRARPAALPHPAPPAVPGSHPAARGHPDGCPGPRAVRDGRARRCARSRR